MGDASLFSGAIAGVFMVAGAFIIGVPMIAFGQLLLVFREIALNTRHKESYIKTQYRTLEILAALTAIIGWVIVLGGLLMGGLSIITPFIGGL